MGETLDLSIIICTRNRSARLQGTLKSLAALKTNHAWEVLFVDNASTDATASVIKAADDCGGRLRYLRVERIGLGAARDAGWRQANGHIIAFTDDDCYLAENYADALLAAHKAHPEAGCIGGRILLYDPADARITVDERTVPEMIPPYGFLAPGKMQGANMSFRRLVLEAIGGFDPEFGAGTRFPCEDIDAIAASLWCGNWARFDPAPVIWHHHGRKESEVPALVRVYLRGSGAYFAKYLLRPDSRQVYLRGWWNLLMQHRGIWGLYTFTLELASAFVYLRNQREYGFILAAAPVALAAYVWDVGLVTFRTLRRWLGRLARKLRLMT